MACCCKYCVHRKQPLCTRFEEFNDEEEPINCEKCTDECTTMYCSYFVAAKWLIDELEKEQDIYFANKCTNTKEVQICDDGFMWEGELYLFEDYGTKWVFEYDKDALEE